MRAGIFGSAVVPASGGGITATFMTALGTNTNSGSGATFASAGIGSASATRRVVVAVATRHSSALSFSSVTIGGVSATAHVTVEEPTGNNDVTIASAVVTSGSTADIVISYSGGPGFLDTQCLVWVVDGVASDITDTDSGSNTTSIALSATSGAVLIACGVTQAAPGALTVVTERSNAINQGQNTTVVGGDATGAGSSTFTANANNDNAAALAVFDAA